MFEAFLQPHFGKTATALPALTSIPLSLITAEAPSTAAPTETLGRVGGGVCRSDCPRTCVGTTGVDA